MLSLRLNKRNQIQNYVYQLVKELQSPVISPTILGALAAMES